MAISEDAAAQVAAQLTVAWSNLFAAYPGAAWLSEDDLPQRVAKVYERFRTGLLDGDQLGAERYSPDSLV